jgi:hypothetical protein
LSPKGEFWNLLERALDLSKNVSEPAKNDLGISSLRGYHISLIFMQYSYLSPDFSRACCVHFQGTQGRSRSFLLQVPDNAGNGRCRQRLKGENFSA